MARLIKKGIVSATFFLLIAVLAFWGVQYFSSSFNHRLYSDRWEPVLEVTLNEEQIHTTLEALEWSYLKGNKQWASNGRQNELMDSSNGTIFASSDQLKVSADKDPDYIYYKIIEPIKDQIVAQGQLESLGQLPLPGINGNFHYQIELKWQDEGRPFRGQARLIIPVVASYPEKFVFSKNQVIQGDLLEVSLYNVDNLEDIFFEQGLFAKFRWYLQDDGTARGYLPTNFSVEPGTYQIKYGNQQKGTQGVEEIQVLAHSYRIQHLTISREIEQSTRNDAAYAEFAKYFTPVRQKSAPVRYYTDNFIIPTQGRLTTEFGQTRYVNGAPTSSRHSGLDIAAPTGTPIRAVNCGKVVLSMPLILTGNTVVIDHGEGLFSVYYHNHENLVSVGERVERGQEIATVGTTGFSTGPHLHFTMSYYSTNIEPGFLLVGQPITVANHREFLQN